MEYTWKKIDSMDNIELIPKLLLNTLNLLKIFLPFEIRSLQQIKIKK